VTTDALLNDNDDDHECEADQQQYESADQ